MRQIFSLAGWNWRLARRAYGILCGVFAVEQLAVLLFIASRSNMLGMGLAACYEEGYQFPVFLAVLLLAGLLAGPAVNDWKRAKCSYTWLTLPVPPAARLAAQVLTAAVLQLGVVALQLVLYLVYFFPVQALDSARALDKLGTAMPAQSLYEQVMLSDSLYWLLPRRPVQFVLLAVTVLASALLLTCVRLHRGWRRAAAVAIGVVCGVCCLLLFQWEKDFALYGAYDALVRNTLLTAAVLVVLVIFSIWWALRAIRRAETA
ncbi:hypothetical protein [Subdoligranulum variabile]|uniref:Uncharacterized protein n=1 Tax=Subdoligranulum variabile DSM 15176 TaxID=411471 RepID=D1PSA1_9FIRM|nr:hypothetical protein [Subdoligranulum variabile]EFB74386.1 hypothetical protein SUBVAR_07284 [Subdoligranulum variabile DSM 15176]UWP69476.1 hypothetical protein NQ490_06410 [Subdoligranulum variabile]